MKKALASQRRTLLRTPLYDFHKEAGCKFVDFAGYEMPVQYNGQGLVKEHKAVREASGIFDVSHMGQWVIRGADRARFLEWATPIDLEKLDNGTGSLTVITAADGGIIDDTVVVKNEGEFHMVVNAGCQDKDYRHFESLKEQFDGEVFIEKLDKGLIALQGPQAMAQLQKLGDVPNIPFMAQATVTILGEDMTVTRCGYTGEDGFEISCSLEKITELAATLHQNGVALAGLGARDTLRLEAGLCLYGNDITESTTPIEASLAWLISARRREAANFMGADRIMTHLKAKPKEDGAFKQKRVSFVVSGPPARQGSKIFTEDDKEVGVVTSGTFSPTLGTKIAMGYVNRNLQKAGTKLMVEVRNKRNPIEVVKAPFVPHNYAK
eukprot:TRINITY_DN806_c1_g1_i1.p1 TRINITY_DN806_c1_g1~~TRINITY_DN806_c1_g1_i1.p1  ORF type:complete len:400 (+),score=122.33 TRINITY_DN806_c1_g1_i1:61-1200(+)